MFCDKLEEFCPNEAVKKKKTKSISKYYGVQSCIFLLINTQVTEVYVRVVFFYNLYDFINKVKEFYVLQMSR